MNAVDVEPQNISKVPVSSRERVAIVRVCGRGLRGASELSRAVCPLKRASLGPNGDGRPASAKVEVLAQRALTNGL